MFKTPKAAGILLIGLGIQGLRGTVCSKRRENLYGLRSLTPLSKSCVNERAKKKANRAAQRRRMRWMKGKARREKENAGRKKAGESKRASPGCFSKTAAETE